MFSTEAKGLDKVENALKQLGPRMAKVFADAGALIRQGLEEYVKEVSERTFPGPEHGFGMKDEEYAELLRLLETGDAAAS